MVSLTNVVTIFGLQEVREEQEYRQVCGQQGGNVTVTMVISHTNGLVFHSAVVGGMNARRFDDFLAQTRLNLNPDEHVIFIYEGALALNNCEFSCKLCY